MNERIRELAEQVYGTQATEQEIKFAELIVRECIDIVPWMYEAKIKEHFGVEE